MEHVTGHLIFVLLATPVLAALNGFHYVDLMKNWTEAQSYCRDNFRDLATIHTEGEWTIAKEIMANSDHTHAWIGLYEDVKSWRWSLDNTSLYSRELGSWFNFTEDNYNGEPCADIMDGALKDDDCESQLYSLCYDETTDSYVPVPEPMSWQSAQSYCRQNHTDLASIRDQQELNAVVSVTKTNVSYWIGLSRETWKWSDQSDSTLRPWSHFSRPIGRGFDCGSARTSGLFDDRCSAVIPFICSATIRHSKVLKVTVKTDGSVNLNDPLVQDAILNQMEKDLTGEGLTDEFRLSWKKQPHGHVFNKTEL